MVIKTDRDWPIYTCPNCGLEFYVKYSDSKLCATCRYPETLIIEAKLQGVKESNTDNIIKFNESYIKKNKPVDIKQKKAKNTYFNK